MKKIMPLLLFFILGIGLIGFGIYTILFVASDTSLNCMGYSKICIFEDKALLRKESKELKFDQIIEARVQEGYYTKKGGGKVYYYTTQLVTGEKTYDVITGDNIAEEQAYADQINRFVKPLNITGGAGAEQTVSPNPSIPDLQINYSDKTKRYNSGIMVILIGFFAICVGLFRFITGKL